MILSRRFRPALLAIAFAALAGGCAGGPDRLLGPVVTTRPQPLTPIGDMDAPKVVVEVPAAPPSDAPVQPAATVAEAKGIGTTPAPIVRGQSPGPGPSLSGPGYPASPYGNQPFNSAGPGANGPNRYPMPVSGGPVTTAAPPVASGPAASDPNFSLPPAPPTFGNLPEPPTGEIMPENRYADLEAIVRETQTGRFQFGVGVNSDAGVTGQIVIDERNFDWQRLPTSGQDLINGTAFRGAGQGFRIEAMPGNQVQRYMVSFTEPYLFGYSPISLNLSGFYFQRGYFDYSEERLGGRAALGYRLSPDLSVAAALRAESVDIFNPRVTGVPELDRVVGKSELYTGRVTLTSDTRDIPFFPTEGRYIELAFEQAFGTFDYPRAELDLRRYFLVRQRPDSSGRHTLAFGLKLGFSGSATPMYENYFAGGFSTMRGFNFRGASPVDNTVIIGGPFRLLGSAEYFFPLTADDMIKAVAFCDFGTVEENIEINWDNFRVSPGFGLRINIPALGPAPLALDFAVPVTHAKTDNIQNFSFFFGFGR